ncbi:uncharacterized protein LOC142525036 [Primulina tabacum]|uniref:uncharacterized protein LOC142525036 n=1 Tax=Primulina tabacum TaxID=48773 RepID=UPI003F59DAB7
MIVLSWNSHSQNIEDIRVRLGFETCFAVDRLGRSGGIGVLWRKTRDFTIVNYSRNHVDLIVSDEEHGEWRCTGYYAFPERHRRRDSWNFIRSLAAQSSLSWLCIGNYKDMLSTEDNRGRVTHPQWLLRGFREAIDDCNLTDIPLNGHQFTWERSRDSDNFVEERIDRAMGTPTWAEKFPMARLRNLNAPVSDHSPILLETEVREIAVHKQRFRFENRWLRKPDLNSIMEDFWERNKKIDVIRSLYEVLDEVRPCVTDSQNEKLVMSFTTEEFKEAVFDMKPDKSLGPDGFNPAFFQRFWAIIETEVVSSCVGWLHDMNFPLTLNDTNVAMEIMTPHRGLRQGDPLSPYLFIICTEGLSALIRNAERLGHIHGIKVCRGAPSISHLFFADDSMLFFRANATEGNYVKNIIEREAIDGGSVTVVTSTFGLDPWLRDSSNYFVEKAMIPELHDWTVQDLMVPGSREWDHEIIETIFEIRDTKEITEIPLVQIQLRDKRIWHFSKNGAYTVQSGYHVAMSLDVNLESRKIQGNWKALWKVDVPPKIKSFLWRACRKCLPHRIYLHKRGIQVSALCVVCNKDMETSWHTFITCPYARECWANAKLNQVVEAQAEVAEGFTQWLFKIIQDLSGAELRNFISLARSNKEVHDASTRNHYGIWTPPPSGTVKCNIDAAFFDDIKSAGISMVVRNDEGRFLMARTNLIKGLCCVREGEAIGLLEALSWIRNSNYPKVLFEVDALTVYNAMTESAVDITEFGGIMGRCRDIVATNPCFSVHFTRRQANEVAHVLAKHSRFYASPCVWSETPMCIGALMNMYVPLPICY